MGKENEFKFHSATVDAKENIHAGFDLDNGNWQAVQNITQYKENVKLQKEKETYYGRSKSGYRKMATIPDIVAAASAATASAFEA